MKNKQFLSLHRSMCGESYISNQLPKSLQKLNIITSIERKGSVTNPKFKEILLTKGYLRMSYEALLPLLTLSGHEQRVFLFLAAYYLDNETYSFHWNDRVIDAYQNFYSEISGKSVKTSAIKQAFKKLCKQNVVQRVRKEFYLMNPIYLPRPSSTLNSKKLFNEYTKKSTHTGGDAFDALEYL